MNKISLEFLHTIYPSTFHHLPPHTFHPGWFTRIRNSPFRNRSTSSPSINRCQRAFIAELYVKFVSCAEWEGCIPATSAFEFSSSRKLSQRERDIPVWPVYEPRYVLANLLPTIPVIDIYICIYIYMISLEKFVNTRED